MEYDCAECGKHFTSDWPDDEARAESKQLFGDMHPDDMAIVCDECFNGIVAQHSDLVLRMTRIDET